MAASNAACMSPPITRAVVREVIVKERFREALQSRRLVLLTRLPFPQVLTVQGDSAFSGLTGYKDTHQIDFLSDVEFELKVKRY